MSPRATKIRDAAINALITGVAAVFITTAARVFETSAAHRADIQVVNSKLDRILDALCRHEDRERACASGDVKLDTRLP